MTTHRAPTGAAVRGGHGSVSEAPCAPASIASGGSAARTAVGAVAADPVDRWPGWARAQLDDAIAFAAMAERGGSAMVLYREWFCAPVPVGACAVDSRPLAGVYRTAHAGTRRRTFADAVWTVARNDVLGRDGWWRTWGERWTPPRSRRGSVRVLFTPAPAALGAFVAALTAALLDVDVPWSLTCTTDPRRLRRTGAAVLDLLSLDVLPAGLLDALAPTLLPAAAPLCLPLGPGVALAGYPDNGMTFGEHRCHLIALALRQPESVEDPLGAITTVFDSHGVDPAHPYR